MFCVCKPSYWGVWCVQAIILGCLVCASHHIGVFGVCKPSYWGVWCVQAIIVEACSSPGLLEANPPRQRSETVQSKRASRAIVVEDEQPQQKDGGGGCSC